jgi:hypothetical protein
MSAPIPAARDVAKDTFCSEEVSLPERLSLSGCEDLVRLRQVQQDVHHSGLDKRSYKVFKSFFHVPSSESSEYLRAVKWDDFRRAMVSAGSSAEKLHGSAWRFVPVDSRLGLERGIQFHEPHPESEIRFSEV